MEVDMNMELSRDNPGVTIENVGGDLRVRAWEREQVAVLDDEGQLEPADSGVVLRSDGDLNLRVPTWAMLSVENVGGDAKLSELEGDLTLGHVGGDLTLRDVGMVGVEGVGGDLRVKRADGSVRVERVGGDATVREVEGEVLLEQIGGDLYVRDVASSCRAENVGADLVLSTDFAPGADYYFEVGGDIVCRVPVGASVRFQTAHSQELVVDAPGARQAEGEHGDEVIFGDGEALVSLEAGGEIRLVAQDEDYMMAINFHLEEDLAERLSTIEEQLSEKLSGLDEVIARQSEKIRAKAERSAERAMRQAERAARKTGKRRSFRFSFGGDPFEWSGSRPHGPRAPRAPEPPPEPVSEEERMAILRRVENKQITVKEAEKLLAALEGRQA
jgi:hypothetical protein